jgi:hypothetical protein
MTASKMTEFNERDLDREKAARLRRLLADIEDVRARMQALGVPTYQAVRHELWRLEERTR